MKNFLKRFLSPTPDEWKLAKNIAIGMVTVASAVVLLPTAGIILPDCFMKIAGIVIAVGGTLGITAKSQTTKTPPDVT